MTNVLCVNVGSSSVKIACFAVAASGEATLVQRASSLDEVADFAPDVIAHRIVHGGPHVIDHAVLDDDVRAALDAAVEFAPLHLPPALAFVDESASRYPGRAHVACLDTAFHRHLIPTARRLPIPAKYDAAGVRRYGFHGLSYEYLVDRLGPELGPRAVLAHLGNGASLAAVRDGIGIDTTMGCTPTGGLVMGTRTGDLDPGVLLHLLRTQALDAAALERVVDHESGLTGVAGTGDMRELLDARAAGNAAAALALDIYTTVAAKHVAAMTVALGGLDTLVFTGGVGEHAVEVRTEITARLEHLGVGVGGPVTVRVEPTDEESMMARHAARLVTRSNG